MLFLTVDFHVIGQDGASLKRLVFRFAEEHRNHCDSFQGNKALANEHLELLRASHRPRR